MIKCPNCKAMSDGSARQCESCGYAFYPIMGDIELGKFMAQAMMFTGPLISLFAFLAFDTTVEGSDLTDRVYNMGRMQTQLMLFNGGWAMCLTGSLWSAVFWLKDQFKR